MTLVMEPSPATVRDAAAEKRARLAALLAARAAPSSFVLSYPQQRLWFLDQLEPMNPVYNVPLGYHLHGPLDPATLERSLDAVVRRHEALRTIFVAEEEGPRQVVQPPSQLTLPVVDVGALPAVAAAAEAARLIDQQARTRFDLSRGPLLCPLLIRRGSGRHTLLLTVHHIVFDGWSARVLVAELAALYRAYRDGRPAALPELSIQYTDFAHWQVDHVDGAALEDMLAYWREQLQSATDAGTLHTDHPRPPVQTFRGAHHSFALPAEVWKPLQAIGQRAGATPFMTLLAAFTVILQRYTASDRLLVGTPVANRNRLQLEPLIGFFANTLVLAADLAGDPSFPALLGRIKQTTLGAYAHQDLPFERLVDALQPDRDLAQNPLFQVLFSYREGEEEILALPGVDAELVVGQTDTAKFDLSLSWARVDDTLHGRLEYSADLFAATTMSRMVEHLQTLMTGLAANPQRRLSDLPLLGQAEQDQLRVRWNDTDAGVPLDRRIDLGFAAQAAATPSAVALICDEVELTYADLEARAQRLAHYLRDLGVGPEVPVGLYLERSSELVVGMLAILMAGGAYLPLDPSYPASRLAFLIADAGAPVILSSQRLADELEAGVATVVAIDRQADAIAQRPTTYPTAPGSADNAAYLIYTSGSTGRPKGVVVSHRNATSFFVAMDRVLGADVPGYVPGTWLALTSVAFDISVLEFLWTLSRGFKVVLQREIVAAEQTAAQAAAAARAVDFSLLYFASDQQQKGANRYRLLLEGARFADRHGFRAVWTPERHFHRFGGLYPNPSVVGAALAAITERVAIRAGSVVLPLHDPLRVAEEWSVVDNLSAGRAGISFASGWHANDFALAPESYENRKELMLEAIEEVRALWRGEAVRRRGGAGNEVELKIFPPPVQDALPVWLTSARNPETFEIAGRIGAGVLTHLLGHSIEQLGEKIALYRESWCKHQGEGEGHVALMLHTFVGPDAEEVRALTREPLGQYLRTSFGLLAGLGRSLGHDGDFASLPADELDALVERAVERFSETAALLGTPESCADQVERLKAIGVDEVACLIDFGVEVERTLAGLEDLERVRQLTRARRRLAQGQQSVAAQLRRHGVTHLQCTPSTARFLLADDDTRTALGGLQTMLVGGEALPAALARELTETLSGDLHNMYGPTETTVWSASHPVLPAAGAVPIGRPVANTQIYILDRLQGLAPSGVPGEAFIGGAAVTRGYHLRPGLTAERFVPDAHFGSANQDAEHRDPAAGRRLYRTGDLARWRADGRLEFLGRLDHQVKIRGQRIELGEIEAQLVEHPAVAEAVVVVRDSAGIQQGENGVGEGEGGAWGIAAYCVAGAAGEAAPAHDELRRFLAARLPESMLPAVFIFLDALPLTPNGKVDRNALPAAEGLRATSNAPFRPPASRLERDIAAVWCEVLGSDQVGVDDNFFEIGGNSLLAVQLRTRLLAALGRGPTLIDLFRYPSISALAAALDGAQPAEAGLAEAQEGARKRKQALSRQRARRVAVPVVR